MLGYTGRLCPVHGYEEVLCWDIPDGSVRYMAMRKYYAGICRTALSGTCVNGPIIVDTSIVTQHLKFSLYS